MIEIEVISEDQLQIVQEIAFATWPSAYGEILSTEQIDYMLDEMYSLPSLLNQLKTKKHHFLLVYLDKKPAGFASFEVHYNDSSSTKIHKIYVLPEIQGKGVGKKLITAIAEQAIKFGDKKLILNVNRYNKAQYFYEKLGFSIVSSEDIDIGRGYLMEDYVMEKNIRQENVNDRN